jgi:hypothetical protein
LNYLLDEWLVDVALDQAGKCIAIMLAMTLIERALLPERPAFFVTAGQRGGGKTTLVNADLQREMAEMGLDLVPRDDGSFALPHVLPATGVTPPGSKSDEPEE